MVQNVKCMQLIAGLICLAQFLAAEQSQAAMALLTDDAYSSNDPNRGPGVGGDRNEASAFFEVRFNNTAPRKRIGYLKYNITSIDPSKYSTAILSGAFSTTSHDGSGTWNIYGLNDGEANLDDVPDGSFGEANWIEDGLSYSRGLGVDVSVPSNDLTTQGLDLTEITLLGTITLPGDAPFVSNPTALPLGAFLAADTNGVVTFLIADATASAKEWRVRARENTTAGNTGVQLQFAPEPTSFGLALMTLAGACCLRRSRHRNV